VFARLYYHDDWVEWIQFAEFVYNNSVNESTKETPFFKNYGFHPSMDKFFILLKADTNNKIIRDLSMNFNNIKDILLRSKELYKRHTDK